MTLSISKLHGDGSVTIEFGSSDLGYIRDNITDYPETFQSLIELGWDREGWSLREVVIDQATASIMATDGAIDSIPSGWTFGYPHAYVGDGFLLCPECVAKQIREGSDGVDPEQMTVELFVYDEMPQSGDTCDQCSQYIPGVEPYCGDCTKTDVELVSSDTGEHMLCRDCIAEALVKTRNEDLRPHDDPATLVGVNTYKVGYDTYHATYRPGLYA